MSRPDPLLNFEVVPLRLELLPPPDFLLEMFENEGPGKWLLYCEIAENLGWMGEEAGLMILSGQLHHPQPEVRSCAALAVGQIKSESSVILLKNNLREEEEQAVLICLWIGLLMQGKREYFPDLLSELKTLSPLDLMRSSYQLLSLCEKASFEGLEKEARELLDFFTQKKEAAEGLMTLDVLRSLCNSLENKLKS